MVYHIIVVCLFWLRGSDDIVTSITLPGTTDQMLRTCNHFNAKDTYI